MSPIRLQDPVECLYLALMLRWQHSAPPDRHQGTLDGCPARNTQTTRMAYLLQKIAAGEAARVYPLLERYSRRGDGHAYISKNASWMIAPHPLGDGWFIEGCMSLEQKQAVLQHLTRLGLSAAFAACADDFVAARPVDRYLPTIAEQEEMIRAAECSAGAGSRIPARQTTTCA